jgi:hypothetical protein
MGELKIISDKTSGIVSIKENCQFNNICADKVTVARNITARLYGTVNEIVLKKGSTIYLHGKVSGKVYNEGGEIYIFSKGHSRP